MKNVGKSFLVLLVLIAALAMAGCGGGKETGETQETTDIKFDVDVKEFSVGYSRVDVTPKYPVPLHGYGNTKYRLSDGFLDEIYVTALAMTDAEGNTVILTTSDNCNSTIDVTKPVRERINALTGIPMENIILSATHTHSSVDITTANDIENIITYKESYVDWIVQAILEALADRSPAEMYYDSVDLTGYNFVRHYFTDLDEAVGDNHGMWAEGQIVRHASEPNSEMYILKFERKDAQDILLTNWRAHPCKTGGAALTNISADFICPLRDLLEKKYDCKFAYFQGEAGNMNASSRITSETPKADYYEYGKEMVDLISAQLDKNQMEKVPTGKVRTIQFTYTGKSNTDGLDKLTSAQQIQSLWSSTNDKTTVNQMCKEAGIPSVYACNAIVTRSRLAPTVDIEIHATAIGDFVFVNAPLEIFDTNGVFVRENAPSKYMFYVGYSNEYNFYLPSQYAFEYGCYESDTTKFAAGEGELLASKFVDLLEQVYKK